MKWLLEGGRGCYRLHNVIVPGSVPIGGESSRVVASVFVDVETLSVERWITWILKGSQPGLHSFDFLKFDYDLLLEIPC
ncbi:MAG: hypothetical protein QF579_04855 [Dehalococcoidia bacterium]|nr:hypothetical protein [Dehalococcoidia bacterium]